MASDPAAAEAEALEWIICVLAADPRRAEIFQQLALLDDETAADCAIGRSSAVNGRRAGEARP